MDMWKDLKKKKKSNRGNKYGQHSFHSYMEIHNETSDFFRLLHANNKIHNLYLQCIITIVFEIYKAW